MGTRIAVAAGWPAGNGLLASQSNTDVSKPSAAIFIATAGFGTPTDSIFRKRPNTGCSFSGGPAAASGARAPAELTKAGQEV